MPPKTSIQASCSIAVVQQEHGAFKMQPSLPNVFLQCVDRHRVGKTDTHTACPSPQGHLLGQLHGVCVSSVVQHFSATQAGKQRRTNVTTSSMFPVNAEQLMEVTEMRFFFCKMSNVNSSCMSPMISTDFAPPLSSNVLCVCRIWFLHIIEHFQKLIS